MLPGLASAIAGARGGIQFVGGQTDLNIDGSGTQVINFSLTGGLASLPAEGDLVLVACSLRNSSNIDISISGYTEISDLFASSSGPDSNFGLFYKRMTSTPDTSVTVPRSGTNPGSSTWAVHVWRGVDAVTPLDVAAVNFTDTSSFTPNPGAITPTTPGAVVIVAAGIALNDNSPTVSAGDLSNFVVQTAALKFENTVVGIGSIAWSGGTVDPAAWTVSTSAGTSSCNATTIALRPA